MKKRIVWIDIVRGIAIIFVIIGHGLQNSGIQQFAWGAFLVNFIFAFHLPVFFVASGYLYKSKSIKKSLKSGFNNLLLPYLFSVAIIILGSLLAKHKLLTNIFANNWVSLPSMFIRVAYAAGQSMESVVSNQHYGPIPPVGVIWFLPCMFIAVVLFNLLMRLADRYQMAEFSRVSLILLVTALGILIHKRIFMPWTADSALISQSFFYFGYIVKKYRILETLSSSYYVGSISIWLLSAKLGMFQLSSGNAPDYLVGIVAGCGSSLVIFKASILIFKFLGAKKLVLFLQKIGQGSLLIMCFHSLDGTGFVFLGHLMSYFSTRYASWLLAIILILYRLIIPMLALVIIPHVPFARNFYDNRCYQFFWQHSIKGNKSNLIFSPNSKMKHHMF